ncbi:UPF0176 protein [Seminavis robusta]|uniref:UPF0176 protein n=1 Tax=Seminavis robusta TaxID=568900 RepID=A0A9N8EH60_9STRA|nr:UPF0176 protein [Seminavis robusta]|eukprot:Sro1091_g240240.1 UPF0176 protein (677) ;mRNA; r:5615-7876
MSSSPPPPPPESNIASSHHKAVILFYKYLDPSSSKACRYLHEYPTYYLPRIEQFQKDLCARLGCKGRILLAAEGINGTLSAVSMDQLQKYHQAMEQFDLLRHCGYPLVELQQQSTTQGNEEEDEDDSHYNIYTDIDWKESYLQSSSAKDKKLVEPFPNLKISVVKELVSSGGVVGVQDIANYGGVHLSPREFHQKIIMQHDKNNNSKPVVLIDVRNTFEHAIGHFVNPNTHEAAMNPEMVTFSSFDKQFCENHAETLKDKTVLMYCTGGIRCEKATVMLKKRGVQDVFQLQGGIHRYLETYGETGCFRGRNFQFDQRVSLTPAEHYYQQRHSRSSSSSAMDDDNCTGSSTKEHQQQTSPIDNPQQIVGKCVECSAPYDEISGSRICTVCRDLVLVCTLCQVKMREYHCQRHSEWKAYQTFLEVFEKHELQEQWDQLNSILEQKHAEYSKHVRKTLRKQLQRIRLRMEEIEEHPERVNPNAPRRCRSCREPNTICNGLCWGFWKTTCRVASSDTTAAASSIAPTGNDVGNNNETVNKTDHAAGDDSTKSPQSSIAAASPPPPILPISTGDKVTPGPHWNDIRYGKSLHPTTGRPLEGTVLEKKSWGSHSSEMDCVTVQWDDPDALPRRRQVQIYRWGARAVNGTRMYDLEPLLVQQHSTERCAESILATSSSKVVSA